MEFNKKTYEAVVSSLTKKKSELGEILKTYDYDMFNKMRGNREVNLNHVKRLVKSMKEKYIPQPILVNSDLEVIDGQHRIESCKELKLPVYYHIIPNSELSDVERLNTFSKRWAGRDFLNKFCDLGYKDYIKIREFMDEYNLLEETCQCLLAGKTSWNRDYHEDFKLGKFKIKDLDLAHQRANDIVKIKPYFSYYKSKGFTRALLRLFNMPQYDHKVFLNKLNYCSSMLQNHLKMDTNIEMIEKIYNFNSKKNYIYLTR